MRFGIFGWLCRDCDLLRASQLCLQSVGNCLCDLSLNCKNVSQFAIVSVGPEMSVGQSVDELHIHADLVIGFLRAACEDVRDAELSRDLPQVVRRGLESLRRCA